MNDRSITPDSIVPSYWADAKSVIEIKGRKRTFMRFGWSDDSEADALANAQARADDAATRAAAGEQVRRVDHKLAYNGAEGLPIREQIIARHGNTIITRNGYGALCLNTPNVCFADVDVPEQDPNRYTAPIFFAIVAIGFVAKTWLPGWWTIVGAVVLAAMISGKLARALQSALAQFKEDPFQTALQQIQSFSSENPRWLLRVYRTPQGFRVLVMHRTLDPATEEPFAFMSAIGSDKLYMQMCRNQRCFRARVSPKPWRIGLSRLGPRPGTWPIKSEHAERRQRWVAEYDQQSQRFASCRFVETLGTGLAARECVSVQSLHDDYCKADSALPVA